MIRVMSFITAGVVLVSCDNIELDPLPIPDETVVLQPDSFLMKELGKPGIFSRRPGFDSFGDVLLGFESSSRPYQRTRVSISSTTEADVVVFLQRRHRVGRDNLRCLW